MSGSGRDECEHGSLRRKCQRCDDRKELDELRAEVERLREAAEKAVARCSYGCQPGSYCGRCEPLLAALAGERES